MLYVINKFFSKFRVTLENQASDLVDVIERALNTTAAVVDKLIEFFSNDYVRLVIVYTLLAAIILFL